MELLDGDEILLREPLENIGVILRRLGEQNLKYPRLIVGRPKK